MARKRLVRSQGRSASSRLRQSHFKDQNLADFIENAPIAVHLANADGTILWANAAELKLFGYAPEDYIGHNVSEFHVDQGFIRKVLSRLKAGEEIDECEARIRAKDGSIRFVCLSVSAYAEDGQFVHARCFTRDISGLKRLAELQHQLAAIVESSDDAIISKDVNGIIRSWNKGAERLFGYTAEEIIGKSIATLTVGDRPEEIPEILSRIRRGERIDHYEARRRTKDGRILTVSLTVSPIRDASGEIVGASKIARDISDQRRSGELNERLAAIVESSDDAIISKDVNGFIQSWNKGAERIFGYTAEEIIGKPVATLAVPDRVDEIPDILSRIRRGERVDHYETKRQTKDGRVLSISLSVSPIRDASGTIIGASKVARDVTQERAAEESQRALERELMLLIEASGALLESPSSEDVLRQILDTASRSIIADAYAVWRRQKSGGVWNLITSKGLSETYEHLASQDVQGSEHPLPSEPLTIEDVEQFPLVQHRRAYYQAEGIRSILTVPLNIHGEICGTVVFYYRAPHRFTRAEIRLGAALGNLAAAALGTAELYERQIELRAQAERAERQASFLAEAGAVLSSSLEYEATLTRVAEAAVPTLADWCSVDLLGESGEVRRVIVAHQDPAKVEFAAEFRRNYPPLETDPVHIAVRTGQSIYLHEVTDEMVVKGARSPEHLRDILALGIKSFLVVPMLARGRALGTLTFVSAESGRRYSGADLAFAEELARRAAMAIDNSQLHANIRESESRFRQLANAVPAFVWVTEPDGTASYINDRWYDYTGLARETSPSAGWLDVLHPDDVDRVQASWEKARDGEAPYSVECRCRRADGVYRWFLARALPVRDEAGRTLRWFGTSTDMHDAKEARETAQLLNRVGPVLAAELDPQKLTQSVTDIATHLTRAQFGALLEKQVNERGESEIVYTLSGISREAFDRFPIPRDSGVLGPTFRGEGIVRFDDITEEARCPEELLNLRVRSYLAVPVVSRSGDVLGGLIFGHSDAGCFTEWHERIVGGIAAQAAIALDNARLFTESRLARESAERSNRELMRANADLEQFAYSASHDLKEPIRMISIYSQMLQRKYGQKLDAAAAEYFKFIVEGARRMDQLVQDLLAYAQAVPLSIEPAAPVDTDATLDKSLVNLRRLIEECGATITRQRLPLLFIAEVHLIQLFQNLIENAIKYCGDKPPHIEIDAAHDGDLWRISIRDNGIGIPPQYSEQVFGIFKRLHTSDKYSGTGIGLAVCQRIVHRYGGRIWVESEGEGKGSTFCFTLRGGERVS